MSHCKKDCCEEKSRVYVVRGGDGPTGPEGPPGESIVGPTGPPGEFQIHRRPPITMDGHDPMEPPSVSLVFLPVGSSPVDHELLDMIEAAINESFVEAQSRVASSALPEDVIASLPRRRCWHPYSDSCCSICIERCRHTVISLPCRHEFHPSCITEWFRQRDSCPVCRSKIH